MAGRNMHRATAVDRCPAKGFCQFENELTLPGNVIPAYVATDSENKCWLAITNSGGVAYGTYDDTGVMTYGGHKPGIIGSAPGQGPGGIAVDPRGVWVGCSQTGQCMRYGTYNTTTGEPAVGGYTGPVSAYSTWIDSDDDVVMSSTLQLRDIDPVTGEVSAPSYLVPPAGHKLWQMYSVGIDPVRNLVFTISALGGLFSAQYDAVAKTVVGQWELVDPARTINHYGDSGVDPDLQYLFVGETGGANTYVYEYTDSGEVTLLTTMSGNYVSFGVDSSRKLLFTVKTGWSGNNNIIYSGAYC